VDVDWNTGDLLVIDNVLVGHGRRPFTGSRRVLVAMTG
jgi:alpha-ketoglutarate-dependent taurine dioxygenase